MAWTEAEKRMKDLFPIIQALMQMYEKEGIDPRTIGPEVTANWMGALARTRDPALHQIFNTHLEVWHLMRWITLGMRVYEVALDMVPIIRALDLRGITLKEIEPPLSSLYIEVPAHSVGLPYTARTGGGPREAPVAGIIISWMEGQLSIGLLPKTYPTAKSIGIVVTTISPGSGDLDALCMQAVERQGSEISDALQFGLACLYYIQKLGASLALAPAPYGALLKQTKDRGHRKCKKLENRATRASLLERYILRFPNEPADRSRV